MNPISKNADGSPARSKMSNKAEHVWLRLYAAALAGAPTTSDMETIARHAATLADAAFREASKRLAIGRSGTTAPWTCARHGVVDAGASCPDCDAEFIEEHAR